MHRFGSLCLLGQCIFSQAPPSEPVWAGGRKFQKTSAFDGASEQKVGGGGGGDHDVLTQRIDVDYELCEERILNAPA